MVALYGKVLMVCRLRLLCRPVHNRFDSRSSWECPRPPSHSHVGEIFSQTVDEYFDLYVDGILGRKVRSREWVLFAFVQVFFWTFLTSLVGISVIDFYLFSGPRVVVLSLIVYHISMLLYEESLVFRTWRRCTSDLPKVLVMRLVFVGLRLSHVGCTKVNMSQIPFFSSWHLLFPTVSSTMETPVTLSINWPPHALTAPYHHYQVLDLS